MSRTQRFVGWLVTLLVGAVGCALAASVVDQTADRLRARDGAPAKGTVVERYRSPKALIPTVEVAYEVDGRTYRRELDAYLDEGERVRVRYLPEDPAVSRVEGEGLTGLVLSGAGALAVGGLTLVSVRRLVATRDSPSPPRRREERPREVVRRPVRLRRGAAVGAAAGALLWAALAALAGAGPPREIATALGGLSGAAASLGAAVALLRAGVRRRGWRYWSAVAALVAGAPLVLAVAVALEG